MAKINQPATDELKGAKIRSVTPYDYKHDAIRQNVWPKIETAVAKYSLRKGGFSDGAFPDCAASYLVCFRPSRISWPPQFPYCNGSATR